MFLYKKVNKDFFKKWTPEMAYVLGFFAADGYITVNKRGGQYWCMQITDKKLLKNIRAVIKSNHKIGIRCMKENEKTIYRLQVGSVEMCNDLRSLGFNERKTKSLAIPYIPKKYFSDFTRGYFDGDGNVWTGYMHKERKTQTMSCLTAFTSSSFQFLKQLHTELLNFGIKKGSLFEPKPNCFRLQFATLDSLKLHDFMYNHMDELKKPLFLQRKRRVFQKFVKMRP